jgi:hypothetical protein
MSGDPSDLQGGLVLETDAVRAPVAPRKPGR